MTAFDVATVRQFVKSAEAAEDALVTLVSTMKPAPLSLLLLIAFAPFTLLFDKRVAMFQGFVKEDQRM